MKINILTLYPEMFPGCLGYSLAGKALAEGKWSLNLVNIRDFSTDNYKSVDDTPFGGGAGMVMKADVLDRAIASVHKDEPIFYLSPRGEVFNQASAVRFAKVDELTFICGRFEGVDQRVLDKWNIIEISIGDFVLSGGEPALLTMLDAIIRLMPDVMGNRESMIEESFAKGLLEYPHYTKPAEWDGRKVPDVLISGNHKKINDWRREQAENYTKNRRPDMWAAYKANKES